MLNGVAGQAGMAAFWLGVVLLLIAGAARGAKLLPSMRALAPAGELVLRGQLVLDGRRRLQLVQAGGHQVLVLSGGTGERILLLPAAVPDR